MIRFSRVSIGEGGLPTCSRCEPPREPSFLPAEEILPRIAAAVSDWDRAQLGPGPNVIFTGAEPFLHPDLPLLVSAATAERIERVCLRTSAAALAAHDNAEGALHAGVRIVQAVLLATGAEHDELTGQPGAFAAAVTGLAALQVAAELASLPVAVLGYVPVCRHTLSHLADTVAALAETGAVAVELAVSPGAAGAVTFSRHLSAALETAVVNGVWAYASGVPADALPGSALHARGPLEVVAL